MTGGTEAHATSKPTCFIAMPITTQPEHVDLYGDEVHWIHVMEVLFKPAIEAAGFEPVSPLAVGADMIHARIVQQLVEADLVLCDLSSLNANVMFEFGIRTALDKPIAVVVERGTVDLPFDTGVINTHFYEPHLRAWQIADEISALGSYISATTRLSGGGNLFWKHFGLTIRAQEPRVSETPEQALLDVRLSELSDSVRDLGESVGFLVRSDANRAAAEFRANRATRVSTAPPSPAPRAGTTPKGLALASVMPPEFVARALALKPQVDVTADGRSMMLSFLNPLDPGEIADLKRLAGDQGSAIFVQLPNRRRERLSNIT